MQRNDQQQIRWRKCDPRRPSWPSVRAFHQGHPLARAIGHHCFSTPQSTHYRATPQPGPHRKTWPNWKISWWEKKVLLFWKKKNMDGLQGTQRPRSFSHLDEETIPYLNWRAPRTWDTRTLADRTAENEASPPGPVRGSWGCWVWPPPARLRQNSPPATQNAC